MDLIMTRFISLCIFSIAVMIFLFYQYPEIFTELYRPDSRYFYDYDAYSVEEEKEELTLFMRSSYHIHLSDVIEMARLKSSSSVTCSVPHLTLENDEISYAFHKMDPLLCLGKESFNRFGNMIKFVGEPEPTEKYVKCTYKSIQFTHGDWFYEETMEDGTKFPFPAEVDADFVWIQCWLKEQDFGEGLHFVDTYTNDVINKIDAPEEYENNQNFDQDNAQKINSTNYVNFENVVNDLSPEEISLQNETNNIYDYGARLQDPGIMWPINDFLYEIYPDYEQHFIKISEKQDVFDRFTALKTSKGIPLDMNILMFGLDSMSHMSFRRKLPKLYKYIQTTLNGVILDNFNIVGDATTKALIPMLTGYTEMELPEVRKNTFDSNYVDVYPLIWKDFQNMGYVTMFAEDEPGMSCFNLMLNGFEEQPTDHYFRPFALSLSRSKLTQQGNNSRYCLGAKPRHKIILDYMEDFFSKYKNIPKFVFTFLSQLSHDNNNPVEYIEKDLILFLENLRKKNFFENTLVAIFGDHGARYSIVRKTLQGKLEERLPFWSLSFPPKYRSKYPSLMQNLQLNSEKLSTPFDIHYTLRDIMNITGKTVDPLSRGISLLREIPKNRSCASAGIEMHWCACLQWINLQTTNPVSIRAALEVVVHINSMLIDYRRHCALLTLDYIHDVRILLPNDKLLHYKKSKDSDQRTAKFSDFIDLDILHIQLVLRTSPNNGLYEATVSLSFIDDSFSVYSDLSRINAYSEQPHCVIGKYPQIRKYCICHDKVNENS